MTKRFRNILNEKMELVKQFKDKMGSDFVKKAVSLSLVATMATVGAANFNMVKAEEVPEYKEGQFIEEMIERQEGEEIHNYYQYVVKTGDCLETISKKMCKFLGVEERTRYWVVLTYLNEISSKDIIHAGDILIFPESFDEVLKIKIGLDENGYTDRMYQEFGYYNTVNTNTNTNTNRHHNHSSNHNYTNSEMIYTVREVFNINYGNQSESFFNAVLSYYKNYLHTDASHTLDTVLKGNNAVWPYVDYIPTWSKMEYYRLSLQGLVDFVELYDDNDYANLLSAYYGQNTEDHSMSK